MSAAGSADILQARNDMKECEWIIFYDEQRGRFACLPTGSKAANKIRGRMTKTFFGTEKDAISEAVRLERNAGITGIFPNKYTYK
jgi:hypothetical protein